MDEYYRVVKALPEPLRSELLELNPQIAPHVQEIRLRVEQPVLFTIKGRLSPCVKFLPKAKCTAQLTKESLQQCFLALCRHSVYAYEEELRQGYFTIPGGNRVGVAGVRGTAGFSAVTSLNLRVARWVTCPLPAEIIRALAGLQGGLLVAGAPGSGKTTFLRSMIVYLGQTDQIFCVVDERGELLSGNIFGLPLGKSIHCDVYTQHPKALAMQMALRCMNPRAIVCDELGTQEDVTAVEAAMCTGTVLLASVHCDAAGWDAASPGTTAANPQLDRLLQTGAFSAVAFLSGREKPGTVARVVNLP